MRNSSITKRAFQRYRSYNPKYFPLKYLSILFDNAAPYFTLWMSSEIVTALYQGREKTEIYTLVAVTLLGNLLIRILSALLRHTVQIHLELLTNNEAAAFHAKTMSLDYEKLENPKYRQLRRKIEENSYINSYGVVQMRMNHEDRVTGLVHLIFCLLLMAEMVVSLVTAGLNGVSIALFAGMLLLLGLNLLSVSRLSRKAADAFQRVGEAMLETNRLGNGYCINALDSRIYCQQPLAERVQYNALVKRRTAYKKAFLTKSLHQIPVIATTQLTVLCSYLIVCLYCVLGVFPVGSVIKYVGYLGNLSKYISWLLELHQADKTNEQYLVPYLDYFDIPNEMYQGSLSVEKRSDKQFDIEWNDVSFRYPGAAEDALKHISLKLKVGERLAVVGTNGSGKTTFIKLLCRLYDPTDGEIMMNDFNIRKYDYRQYLDLFSVVFQDYNLLSVPLGNNVSSAEHWDTAKAERLLEEVGFGERYRKMSMGLDTPINKDFDENGVKLSGGEAQKIALARALYRDAPFIILDEPTAALDPIAEAEIYSRFDAIVGDKTAIYISHRLSSCRFCDKIAVFDHGEIVQIGTHEELLADKRGKYYELWNAQAKYYTEKQPA